MSHSSELIKKHKYLGKKFNEYKDDTIKRIDYILERFEKYFQCPDNSIKLINKNEKYSDKYTNTIDDAIVFSLGFWKIDIIFYLYEEDSIIPIIKQKIPLIIRKDKDYIIIKIKMNGKEFKFTEEEFYSNSILKIFEYIYDFMNNRYNNWIETNFIGYEPKKEMGFR